jgi:hypothetical protein
MSNPEARALRCSNEDGAIHRARRFNAGRLGRARAFLGEMRKPACHRAFLAVIDDAVMRGARSSRSVFVAEGVPTPPHHEDSAPAKFFFAQRRVEGVEGAESRPHSPESTRADSFRSTFLVARGGRLASRIPTSAHDDRRLAKVSVDPASMMRKQRGRRAVSSRRRRATSRLDQRERTVEPVDVPSSADPLPSCAAPAGNMELGWR